MKTCFLPMINKIDSLRIEKSMDRVQIATLASALAIASMTALPSAPVEDVWEYFLMQVTPMVNNDISEFNEALRVDCQALQKYVKEFWMVRYTTLHPCTRTRVSMPWCDFFEEFIGVGNFSTQETLELLDKHKKAVIDLFDAAVSALKDMRDE